jgi:outer membrane protein OmpA-like peptidoglycan-associated protein
MKSNTLGNLLAVARLTLVAGIAGVVLAAGCAATPESNAMLENARAAYQAALNDPAATDAAAVTLDRAENELARAERLLDEGADTELVEHHAYLAQRHAELARERGRLAIAEQKVAAADAQRKEVLLEARTREARSAEERAEARKREATAALASAEQSAQQAAASEARAEQLRAEAMLLQDQIRELEARPTPRGLVLTLGDVLFDTAEAELKAGAERSLDELVTFLEEYPERNVVIEGFTDSRGSDEYNLGLSERRARAVEAALMSAGIDRSRLRAEGFGEAYPVASNEAAAGQQLNRRVEIIISDDSGEVPARTAESH